MRCYLFESFDLEGKSPVPDAYTISFITIFCLLSFIRFYYKVRYRAFNFIPFSKDEGIIIGMIRVLLGIPLLLATFFYCFFSDLLPWTYVNTIPGGLRIASIAVSGLSLCLLVWVHEKLGPNFSTLIRKSQTKSARRRAGSEGFLGGTRRLVTTGPYRFVRHPMYVAYMMLFCSAFLLSENWVIGTCGVSIIASLMVLRLPREEALLVELYGDDYLDYGKSTSRFFPSPRALFIDFRKAPGE